MSYSAKEKRKEIQESLFNLMDWKPLHPKDFDIVEEALQEAYDKGRFDGEKDCNAAWISRK